MKSFYFTVMLLSVSLLTATSAASADYTLYYYDLSGITLDGTIDANEYATSFVEKAGQLEMSISWAHNGTHMAIGVSGEFHGWVGFGMNALGGGMAGSDMIIASISSGQLEIADYRGTGYELPPKDADQMPISAAGKEDATTTTVEFIIPLSSDDAAGQDHTWKEGETYSFFFAYHADSDTLTQHTAHTQVLSVLVADQSVPLPENRNVGAAGITESDAEKLASTIVLGAIGVAAVVIIAKNAKLT